MKSPFFVNSFISLVFFTLLCASNQYSFYWIYAKSLFYKFIDMRYSVIIPVYNRPDEVDELLQSLTVQCFKDFEVVIVEDGWTSSISLNPIPDRGRPVTTERSEAKENILSYWTLMSFCPKDILTR